MICKGNIKSISISVSDTVKLVCFNNLVRSKISVHTERRFLRNCIGAINLFSHRGVTHLSDQTYISLESEQISPKIFFSFRCIDIQCRRLAPYIYKYLFKILCLI